MINTKKAENLEKYSPVGTKPCRGICERDVVFTKDGPVVVCDACNRVVIDNRNKK